jgi:hypothetical protein
MSVCPYGVNQGWQLLNRNTLHLYSIVIFGLALCTPVLLFGFPLLGEDAAYHYVWYRDFSTQVTNGEFYPRWLPNLNNGLGSPVFYFYPPLTYYITTLVQVILPFEVSVWHYLGVSAAIGMVLSGIFSYIWLKNMTGPVAALLGSLIYMLSPYHLGIDLFKRGAFGEFWAFVWMPLILYFVTRIEGNRRFSVAGLAVAYASLCLTHLPTTLIFSAIPLLYAIYRAEPGKRAGTISRTVAGMMLGSLLSAIYLLPALTTQKYVSIAKMTSGALNFRHHFLFSYLVLSDNYILKLTIAVLSFLLLILFCYLLSMRLQDIRLKRMRELWIYISILSIFLMTPASAAIWSYFKLLAAIQFPWRFNSILCLSCSVLIALAYHSSRRYGNRYFYSAILMIVAGWLVINFNLAWKSYPASHPAKDEIAEKISGRDDAPEYLPRWVKHQNLQPAGSSEPVYFSEGYGTASLKELRPREISLSVNTSTGGVLAIQHFYYSGWSAETGSLEALPVSPTPEGRISVAVPRGEYRLRLYLTPLFEEVLGEAISLSAFFLLLLIFLYDIYRRDEFSEV